MSNSTDLSLEQEYSLRVFAEHIQSLSHEEALQNLVDMYRQMLIRDNYYRKITT